MDLDMNKSLVIAGGLSAIASVLHIGIIIGGASWYRFFGAGEEMASMAERGMLTPHVITAGIALVLMLWALYAFSGAGLIPKLPLMKWALALISAIYLLRGLVLLPLWIFIPSQLTTFMLVSSVICLGYGLFYAIGTKQVWRYL